MSLIDNAVYVDGLPDQRSEEPRRDLRAAPATGSMAWIGLYRPDANEIRSVADEFELHELAVEDAVAAHQRPKIERYDSTLFTVLRPARYVDVGRGGRVR